MSSIPDFQYVRRQPEQDRDWELEDWLNNYVAPDASRRTAAASAPPNPSRWDRWFQTDTGHELVYYGSTTGWKPPWNLPWGRVAGVTSTGYGAFGIGGSGVATTAGTYTVVDTISSLVLPANRRYRFTATIQMYSPAGATNAVLYVADDGTTIAQSERIPSTTVGTAIFSCFERNTVGSPDTSTWDTAIIFSGATGFVLQDGIRYSNLIIEDIGPFSTAPTS
jgi:hypothetical protein